MSSSPSDVLATVFLFVCICITLSAAYSKLFDDQKACTPLSAPSHRYIKPQAILTSPMWPYDLPAPREPLEPTFEPRPEPEPLARGRYNGLIPRAKRRVRPALSSQRPVQRERHMTEMSHGERAAAAAKEIAQERYLAQKEQDRHWRSKALAYEATEAERKEAASRTGGSDVSADSAPADDNGAHDKPTKASRDVRATPGDARDSLDVNSKPDKASNNLATEDGHSEQQNFADTTKTADVIGSTHATEDGHVKRKTPNIHSEVANNPYRGFTQGIQAERRVGESSNALTGSALYDASVSAYASPMNIERSDNTAQSLVGTVQDSVLTPSGTTTMAAQEETKIHPTITPTNPLLEQSRSETLVTLCSVIQTATSSYNSNNQAWFQDLDFLFMCWWQWIYRDGEAIWDNVSTTEIVSFARFASKVHDLVQRQHRHVTNEMKEVCGYMVIKRAKAEGELRNEAERARIKAENQARINEEEQARIRGEEQGRIRDENRQRAIHIAQMQKQEPPQTPRIEKDEDDLYGNSPRVEASLNAFKESRKIGLAESQSNTAKEMQQASEQDLEAALRARIERPEAQPEPAIQQQPATGTFKFVQQASVPDATSQHSPRYPVGLLNKLDKTTPNNIRSRKRNTKNAQTQLWTPRGITEALSMQWTREDITPDENRHPLPASQNEFGSSKNNDIVDGLRRWLKAPAITNEGEIEQYKLLFGREGVKPATKQMSDRYLQIRDHACHRRGNTQVFDWQRECISVGEIRANELEELVGKDISFLSDMRNALRSLSQEKGESSLEDLDYGLVLEAYEIALSVSHSIKHISAPAGISIPTSRFMAGPDSPLNESGDPSTWNRDVPGLGQSPPLALA